MLKRGHSKHYLQEIIGAIFKRYNQLGSGTGVRCSMFAAVCYQASAIANQVTSCAPGTWVSNKYTDISKMEKKKISRLSVAEIRQVSAQNQNLREMKKFNETINQGAEYPGVEIRRSEERIANPNHPLFKPAVLNWASTECPNFSKFDFQKAVTPGLYFDQKTIDIVDMVASLEKDQANRHEETRVVVEAKALSDDEKLDYTTQVRDFLRQADDNTDMFKASLKTNLGLDKPEVNISEIESDERSSFSPSH
ncbi:MAG: hypothetical protein M3R00_03740 [Pseudomonadota bacterium]|nr:hypothetical protein [Pseudomonadota bacterium]